MAEETIGVAVAHSDPSATEEIAELIDAVGDLFVAATSIDAAVHAQVIVAGGEVLTALRPMPMPVIALASDVRGARAALSLGARDLVDWPRESARLVPAIRLAAERSSARAGHGVVIAVCGARGGIGTSTIAMAIARATSGMIADLDAGSRGCSFVHDDDEPPVLRAIDEHAADAVRAARRLGWAGVPIAVVEVASVADASGFLRVARALGETVVIDLGRCQDPAARAIAAACDRRVLVVPNDVAGVRGARALLGWLPQPLEVLVRRMRRDGVAVRDVAAALGDRTCGLIPNDGSLARAADLGEWPARPTRAIRATQRVVEGWASA